MKIDLNRATFTGRLTRDTKNGVSTNGNRYTFFTIAVNEERKNRDTQEETKKTLFLDCKIWGNSADVFHRYMGKGREVLVEGQMWPTRKKTREGHYYDGVDLTVKNWWFMDGKKESNDTEGHSETSEDMEVTSSSSEESLYDTL